VVAGVGAFGAVFAPQLAGLAEPVLVNSTDGLGTKTLLHARFGTWELAGEDLVGTVLNDVLCLGARPLYLLDYIGWHGLTPEQLAAIVRGVARGCSSAGCALIGGELAEMRAIYSAGDFDLTGTGVGLADRSALWGAERVQPGSVLLGLASSGVHANGFSLARRALEGLSEAQWQASVETPRGPEPFWQALVAPTRCYAGALAALRGAGIEVQAAAHISGGGLVDNLPRVIPGGLQARASRSAVPPQAVFATIQQRGQVGRDEMWHVFNMGCGFVLIAAPEQAAAALPVLNNAGFPAFRLGSVEEAPDASRFAWAD
jgi:phosphoribosylformylglycinamidine cyclo-ligase